MSIALLWRLKVKVRGQGQPNHNLNANSNPNHNPNSNPNFIPIFNPNPYQTNAVGQTSILNRVEFSSLVFSL